MTKRRHSCFIGLNFDTEGGTRWHHKESKATTRTRQVLCNQCCIRCLARIDSFLQSKLIHYNWKLEIVQVFLMH